MTWTWLTPPRGPAGPAGAPGPAGPPGPAANSCVDFVINSQADLNNATTPSGNDHIVNTDGTYCFGAFSLTPQHRIVVPSGLKVEFLGHGTTSLVSGNVDSGPVLLIQAGSTVHVHDFKLENTSAVATPIAMQVETTEAYVHDFAVRCNEGEGVRVTTSGARFFASQLRISNCKTGISCRGGEVFLINYDAESVDDAVSVDSTHGGVQWLGGRCANLTRGLRVQADCESIVLQGLTAVNLVHFVTRIAGTVNRANVNGNTVANINTGLGGAAINWASASIPTGGLVVVGNNFNVPFANVFSGFDHTTGRVNSKANSRDTALMSETPFIFFSGTVTPGSIAAGQNASTSVTITGAAVGNIVAASPRTGLANGLVFSFARVSAANTVQVNISNHSAGALTPASQTWDFCLFRPL